MYAEKEIRRLTDCLVEKFNPHKVILFGSQAKGTATEKSDIDLCVVADFEGKYEDKRKLRGAMNKYLALDCDADTGFDLVLYAPDEWEGRKDNKGDFAHIIKKDGVVLHG